MPSGSLIVRRDAHQPMDARFGRQQTVCELASNRESHALEPGFFTRLIIDNLALEPAALCPPQIHPEEHLGPVLRLGPSGAWMDCDDGVLAIVLAAEHLLD